ncbi:MAG: 6-hydroxymethylpterin diphosphokinase MptE-like protein [Candidatus Omnitrophota bacterium]
MQDRLYEKNLVALERRYPQAAAALRRLPPELGEPITAGYEEAWLRKTLPNGAEQAVLLGAGDGTAIEMLRREFGLRNLAVVEKDWRRLAWALQNRDLSETLSDPHVFLALAAAPEALEDHLEYVKTSLAAHGFQLLRHPSIPPEDASYYDAVQTQLRRMMEREAFSLRARLTRGPLVQRNLITNLPEMLSALTLDDARGRFAGTPAVIAAGGPSLDRNVKALRNAQGRALLLGVDTAVRTLQRHGVEPPIVVATDPSPENDKHLEGVELPPKTLFAFSPDCYYAIPRRYRSLQRRLCVYDDSARFTYWLKNLLGFEELIPRPLHVAETAIRLALVLGCNPIVFTGLDLAIPPAGGMTHSSLSARAARVLRLMDDEMETVNADGTSVKHKIVYVEGIRGEPVATLYSFKFYLERLEALMASSSVRWIDATEGGALKKGAEIRPLNEVIAEFDNLGNEFEKRLQALPKVMKFHPENCVKSLNESFSRLRRLEERMNTAAAGNWNLVEIEGLWRFFLRDEETRALLDHAVFPFQLEPPLERIPFDRRNDYLYRHLKEAHSIVKMFFPIWEESLQRLLENIA